MWGWREYSLGGSQEETENSLTYKALRGLLLSRKVSQSITFLALDPFLTGSWSLQFLEITMIKIVIK